MTESERTERSSEEPADQTTDQTNDEPSEEEVERERRERLDPENRPEMAEVDNTDRDFDEEKGLFTDSPGYEEAERKFPPMGDQGA